MEEVTLVVEYWVGWNKVTLMMGHGEGGWKEEAGTT